MSLAASPSDGQTSFWTEVIHPEQGDLHPEVARYFLNLKLAAKQVERLHDLLERNQAGALNSKETEDLRDLLQYSMQIELFRAKARVTLHNQQAQS